MIILVDGANLVHRSYHTFKTFSNNTGYPTGAIYGFFSILMSYINKLGTKNVIICWDSKREDLWRKSLYPDYKATRKDKDEDISKAFLDIFSLCNLCGLVQVKKIGYEADDLISSITRLIGNNIRIMSGDKDLLQLVNDNNNIKVLRPHPKKGLILYSESQILERYGISVADMALFLSIWGDTSDNIKGLQGYGEKKSARIINENQDPINIINKMYPNFKEALKLNLELIDLLNDRRLLNLDPPDVKLPKPDLYILNSRLFMYEISAFNSKELIDTLYSEEFQNDIFPKITTTINLYNNNR